MRLTPSLKAILIVPALVMSLYLLGVACDRFPVFQWTVSLHVYTGCTMSTQ